jgi:hypothetical protein
MADLLLISPEMVAKLSEGLAVEDDLPPLEKIRGYVADHPQRIPQLFALVVRDMPYYQVLRHFEWMKRKELFREHGAKLIEVLGPARACMGFMAFFVLEAGDKTAFAEIPRLPVETNMSASPPPDMQKVANLDAEMSKQLIPMGSLGKGDLAEALSAAEKRAVKAEKELKDAQEKWLKREKRLLGDAERAKKNEAEKVHAESGKASQASEAALRSDLTKAEGALANANAALKAAMERLQEVEDCGGATPERVEEIRKEIQRDADQRIEDELSIAVRPWLVKLQAMQKSQVELQATQALSTQTLAKAKQEAGRSDIIGNWESDRERALKVLEQEMTELDNLMMRVVKPSPELVRMHSELLQAMLACRKQLNPSKPLGEVAKALIAGLKKVKDEELGDAAYAVKKLAEKGVFLGLEAETLIKIVEGEKQARYDQTHFKKSVQGRLFERLHAGQDVDMLVDGYNYMFTAHQYFGDKLKLNRNAEGEAVFGETGRAKLVSLLVPVVEKFPSLQVDLFFDGLVKESKQPHPRITLWQPTYQRSGKGQADAEIAHVGLKNIRKGSMAVVVSNDKVVQRHADNYLSVRLFSDFIANH